MKRILIILLIAFPRLASADALSDLIYRSIGPGSSCTNWTPAEWDKYLAEKLLGNLKNTFGMHISQSLRRALKECGSSTTSLQPCFDRTLRHFEQFEEPRKGQYSFRYTDQEFDQRTPDIAKAIPKEFAKGLTPDWEKVAARNGWQWVHFPSETGNSDRLIFRIPGDKYDRLLLFAGNEGSTDPTTYPYIQMQTLEKRSDGKPIGYFVREWQQSSDGPQHSRAGGLCIGCHASGPRAAQPSDPPRFKVRMGGVESLAEFNKLVTTHGPIDLSVYFDPSANPKHPEVGKADMCTNCHDGKKRGDLGHAVTSWGSLETGQLHRKVVHEKTMPADLLYPLDTTDRENIVKHLEKEYLESKKKWLTEVKCVDAAKGPGASRPLGK